MSRAIRVHLAPALVSPEELTGRTVLMIDLLRASTTICHALAAGALEVLPFVEVEDVRCAASQASGRGEQVVCGGERGGRRIEGFDLGNSPRDYTPSVVSGKRVLFTTSNGTRALHHARLAERILVACLANLSAVTRVLQDAAEVDILCAGSGGSITREDVVAAGAYAAQLSRDADVQANDSVLLALDTWRMASDGMPLDRPGLTAALARCLAEGKHGRHLISLGYEEDLTLCATIDSIDLVAVYDTHGGSIKGMRSVEL